MALLLVLEYGVYFGMLGLGEVAWEISSSTQLILWNETISRVRGGSAQLGENMLPSSGSCSVLKLNGHRHWGRFIGVGSEASAVDIGGPFNRHDSLLFEGRFVSPKN